MKYRIRFNKSAGKEGRGSKDHVWRVFDEEHTEYLCKNVVILVSTKTELDSNLVDWNFVCNGTININYDESTITIGP
jgi:hypothetical protein